MLNAINKGRNRNQIWCLSMMKEIGIPKNENNIKRGRRIAHNNRYFNVFNKPQVYLHKLGFSQLIVTTGRV